MELTAADLGVAALIAALVAAGCSVLAGAL